MSSDAHPPCEISCAPAHWGWKALNVLALVSLAVGLYLALLWAPPERDMGDVYRVLFVHVPSAWMALVAFTLTFGASIWVLAKNSAKADAIAEASAEVGVVFSACLLLTGSIWAKPTWGTFWTWDPRLTTAAIMLFAFVGYLSLRRFVEDPYRRMTWAAATAILIYVDIPLVWFSVKVWNTLHQVQSSPSTMDGRMVVALRVNAFAALFLLIAWIHKRYRIARLRQAIDGLSEA